MANKVSMPSAAALADNSLSFGTISFLQSAENSIRAIDNAAVYKDAIEAPPTLNTLRAISAQGTPFLVSGVSVASGTDYAALVSDVKTLLQSHTQLQQVVSDLIKQLRGK